MVLALSVLTQRRSPSRVSLSGVSIRIQKRVVCLLPRPWNPSLNFAIFDGIAADAALDFFHLHSSVVRDKTIDVDTFVLLCSKPHACPQPQEHRVHR